MVETVEQRYEELNQFTLGNKERISHEKHLKR